MSAGAAVSLGARIRFLLMAGVGFFTDGYLNIVIGLVVPMIGDLYFEKGSVPAISGDEIKGALSIGMVVGQLGFGLFGDALGRHKVYGKELILTIFGTLMVVLLPWKGLSSTGVVAWLAVWRVVTGFGIGGDYPMSSTLAAEKSAFGSRAKLVLSVFCCIGIGGFTSSVVNTVLLAAGRHAIERDIKNLEWVWRVLLGLGVVPAALSLYARLTMKETAPYEQYVSKETGLAKGKGRRGLSQQFKDFREYFSDLQHAKTLFAVSAVWFLYDIAFYGINYNQSIILADIGFAKGKTKYDTLFRTAVGNIIVQSAGYLPGFFIGIFLPDFMGRVRQQFIFCLLTAILYAIWAGVSTLSNVPIGGLMTLFTIAQLVLNAGPNCTTFLIPTEVFPTRVRGSAHGIAAASGKAGAILTAFAFGTIVEKIGLPGVLGLFSGIMGLAALITLMIPETRGLTIQDIEDDKMYRRGERESLTQVVDNGDEAYLETPSTIMKGTDPVVVEEMKDLV